MKNIFFCWYFFMLAFQRSNLLTFVKSQSDRNWYQKPDCKTETNATTIQLSTAYMNTMQNEIPTLWFDTLSLVLFSTAYTSTFILKNDSRKTSTNDITWTWLVLSLFINSFLFFFVLVSIVSFHFFFLPLIHPHTCTLSIYIYFLNSKIFRFDLLLFLKYFSLF